MMKIKDIKDKVLNINDSILQKYIIKEVLQKEFFFDDENVEKQEYKLFKKINKGLKKGKTIDYIIGKRFFFKNYFYVNKNTLVPRKETELIVEEVLKLNLLNKNVVDVCCGSGCIGISIKKEYKDCNLYLSDISKKALKVANKNLCYLNVDAKVFNSNYLKFIYKNNIKPDIITINPPYIGKKDILLDKKVHKNEPKKALFAKENGLYFYKKLLENLDGLFKINKNLIIYVEFGYNQKKKLEEIFCLNGVKYIIEFKKDYSNIWRYFILKKV
ncbi:release factor glutamine methyltransferase [Spiroplasma corruscae]|uniref:peptide chain release factor N(5)-glutamine methyltransferase n=1 Tax=Spiroplasma corruscae TaxID=216934 RepID=A0A222ERA7_9MOLU|nr:peptide chain release factor N(5)-glutamine methyltransferase [Spiroplasma corruscae]ASP28733.1 release factor glutamine methyltransferase [Spiroplasma corruscae]